jgi:hypothetical protein
MGDWYGLPRYSRSGKRPMWWGNSTKSHRRHIGVAQAVHGDRLPVSPEPLFVQSLPQVWGGYAVPLRKVEYTSAVPVGFTSVTNPAGASLA